MARPRRHHVVPKGYLTQWAAGNRIVATDVRDRRTFETSPRNVGVISNYYRRFGDDGLPNDDVEENIALGESVALPVLRTIDARWPLSSEDKAHTATLLAIQTVRGVRWRQFHDMVLVRARPSMRERIVTRLEDREWRLSDGSLVTRREVDDEFEAGMDRMRADTEVLARMMNPIEKIASILGSMHWTLLRFESPALVAADEPVVVWPLATAVATPRAWPANVGLLPTIEIRFPVSPSLALMLTWIDDEDGPVVPAHEWCARNINAFTVAHASRQWFSLPGTSPGIPGAGVAMPPISTIMLPGYSAEVATESVRRAQISRIVQARLGDEPTGQMTILKAVRTARPTGMV